ncbi:hypothetical protein [Pseudomonas aeruginosa]|uniref:hypothetical protein n=1 Tax=Pseudomonas aeruginosa TaxID=287 RepID=UPI0015964AEC|nr:hypothetical protein [Pseudomonas aeruginosa]
MNKALDLLHDLVSEVERKTCCHEETHRGGAIWEICDSCGAKWADDEGGKPEFAWPESVDKARAFLATHPAVEQAGGDERKLSDLGNELHNLSCAITHTNEEWAEQISSIARELWKWPDRAALAQPSPVPVGNLELARTLFEEMALIADDEKCIHMLAGALAQPSPKCATCGGTGMVDDGEITCSEGGIPYENGPVKCVKDCPDCKAQPSPAQAEAERPEVVAVRYEDGTILSAEECGIALEVCAKVQTPLMTVSQHERIVGALRAEITQLRQHKNDYMDAGQETYRALQNEIREREAEIARLDGLVSGRTAERDAALAEVEALRAELQSQRERNTELIFKLGSATNGWGRCEKERDAALARVAELEGQSGFEFVYDRDELVAVPRGLLGAACHAIDKKRYAPRIIAKLREYARGLPAPVAQAQQLNDLDKQCRDDVARALGLRPNQERGFAWSYLLASIKSCVKASEDSAKAQHSVPIAPQLKRALGLVVAALEADGDRPTSKYALSELKKVLAAAPAQAQHSVPEEFIGRLSEFLAQRGITGKALLRELRAMLAAAPAQGGE